MKTNLFKIILILSLCVAQNSFGDVDGLENKNDRELADLIVSRLTYLGLEHEEIMDLGHALAYLHTSYVQKLLETHKEKMGFSSRFYLDEYIVPRLSEPDDSKTIIVSEVIEKYRLNRWLKNVKPLTDTSKSALESLDPLSPFNPNPEPQQKIEPETRVVTPASLDEKPNSFPFSIPLEEKDGKSFFLFRFSYSYQIEVDEVSGALEELSKHKLPGSRGFLKDTYHELFHEYRETIEETIQKYRNTSQYKKFILIKHSLEEGFLKVEVLSVWLGPTLSNEGTYVLYQTVKSLEEGLSGLHSRNRFHVLLLSMSKLPNGAPSLDPKLLAEKSVFGLNLKTTENPLELSYTEMVDLMSFLKEKTKDVSDIYFSRLIYLGFHLRFSKGWEKISDTERQNLLESFPNGLVPPWSETAEFANFFKNGILLWSNFAF